MLEIEFLVFDSLKHRSMLDKILYNTNCCEKEHVIKIANEVQVS